MKTCWNCKSFISCLHHTGQVHVVDDMGLSCEWYEREDQLPVVTQTDRLTRWEGRDEDGPRAVMVNREKPFHEAFQEILRKLAKYEDEDERRVNQRP